MGDLFDDLPTDLGSLSMSEEILDDGFDRGMKTDIKHFYREDHKHPWNDWTPDADKLDAERLRNSKFAVIVRSEMDTDIDSGLTIHSITIQSPLLRKLLDEVFEGYRGLSTKMKDLTFNRPFRELFYRWDRYEACTREQTDEETLRHIELFNNIVEPEVRPHLEHAKGLREQNTITFDYLWVLFEPDCEVFTVIDRQDRILQLTSSAYQKTQQGVVFMLTCRFVNFDGVSFGYQTVSSTIMAFEGHKCVLELSAVPMKLHPQREDNTKRLTERGKAFEQLQGFHYKSYSGFIRPADEKRRRQKIANGRVIIDADLYNAHNSDAVVLEALHDIPKAMVKALNGNEPTYDPFGEDPYMLPPPPMPFPYQPMPRRTSHPDDAPVEPVKLQDHHYRICTSMVRGYCLTSKQWVKLAVDCLQHIKWNPASFKRLILPQDYKELILSFIGSHLENDEAFDDIIQGKGKGIVILLSGVPGVGKTLTAEAVAEQMKRPLYSMNAGQLGWDADTVEENLRDVLEICAKWGAVLLIDEADVFLEQRQLCDINRNKLVAVFLRLLEYYEGCMFLTTNRVSSFDLAFKSRIDLIIDYPKLDFHTKREIWQTFVKPSEDFPQNTSTINKEELDVLARIDINGREIKNLVKTGRLLAKRRGEVLGIQHLRTVVNVQTGVPAIEDIEAVYPPLD